MTGKDASRKPPPPHAPLLRMAYGALITQILCVAAQLGLAERLALEGPCMADKLAPDEGVATSTVERILRALVSLGVCEEIDGNRFRLTALCEFLRPGHPNSVEARVLLNGQVFYRMWGELFETVRTGESGPQRVVGMPLYEYFVNEPQIGALFDRTMTSVARHRHRPPVGCGGSSMVTGFTVQVRDRIVGSGAVSAAQFGAAIALFEDPGFWAFGPGGVAVWSQKPR